MQNPSPEVVPAQPPRILARHLARELTKEELAEVSGGMPPRFSSSSWSSSGSGEGDDGGADD